MLQAEPRRAEFKGSMDNRFVVLNDMEAWLAENQMKYEEVEFEYPDEEDPNVFHIVVIEKK